MKKAKSKGTRERGAGQADAGDGRSASAAAPTASGTKKAKSKRTRKREGASGAILDELYATVLARRNGDTETSHSARLLSRGTAKVAQKFGEEAVECLIEAVAHNRSALVMESADVLYHLLVLWVASGLEPADVWAELGRRQGISGIAEKSARADTAKIP